MQKLNIKVCGMKHRQNIEALMTLQPDFVGFIFYPPSKRYVGNDFATDITNIIQPPTYKVGVFVDEPIQNIISFCKKYGFQYVQLHGSETPEMCEQLQKQGIEVIKAFRIANADDFLGMQTYNDACSYFLLDTAVQGTHGGTGVKFDWNLLSAYQYPKPFFLSGGIGLTDAQAIAALQHPSLYALDLNSRFETEPALKDINLLNEFIHQFRAKN